MIFKDRLVVILQGWRRIYHVALVSKEFSVAELKGLRETLEGLNNSFKTDKKTAGKSFSIYVYS